MSYQRLAEALLRGKPYFGPALCSLQSPPVRHKYMLPIVEILAGRSRIDILEIGSWAGASAIAWAAAMKKVRRKGTVTCVDQWIPYFDVEKDRDEHYQRMNRAAEHGMIRKLFDHNVATSGFKNTITARTGPSREILPQLAHHSFDVAYLDGSHLLRDVVFDIRQAKRLIRQGGVICGDDLEVQAADLDPADLEAAVSSGSDFQRSARFGVSYHPGVTLAVAREFGQVSAWDGFWALMKTENGWESVTIAAEDARLPRHIAGSALQFEGGTDGYHLFSWRGRFYAVSAQLGPPQKMAEHLIEEDLPPLFFTGRTMDEIRRKIGGSPNNGAHLPQPETELYTIPILMETYGEFNLVRYRGRIYGLRQALGEIDLAQSDLGEMNQLCTADAVLGDSPAEVKARIDAIEAQRALLDLKARIRMQLELESPSTG